MGFESHRISPGSGGPFGSAADNAEILPDGTLRLNGKARTWDDLRVAAHELQSVGANPPTWKLFRDDGIATTDYAIAVNGGSDYGTIPDYSSLDVAGNFSIEAWVKIDNRHMIIADRPNYFRLEVYRNDLRFQIRTGATYTLATTGDAIVDGKWTHVCATLAWDGTETTVRMYVDGVELADGTTPRELSGASSESITVGRKSASSSRAGDIDELIAYNVTLTDSQIAARYENGTASHILPGTITEATEVIFKFDFSEGTGTTADNSCTLGAGHDMTLLSAIWTDGVVTGSIVGGVYLPAFSADAINDVHFALQFSHNTDLTADIHPHIHWSPAGAGGGNVYWELEYTYANVGDTFGATQTMGSAVEILSHDGDRQHCYTNFGVIPGGLMSGVSPMIICTVRRRIDKAEDTLAAPAFLLDIDFHIQIDSIGSMEEFTKWA